jgi:transposase-like protein
MSDQVVTFTRLANSEREAEWERFLRDLYGRGLCAANTKIAVLDGGKGLLAALPTVFQTSLSAMLGSQDAQRNR